MRTPNIKLIYIAGSFRSGTTLLGRLLGEVPQFVNVGEAAAFLFNLEMRSEAQPCGCGEPFCSCPFWTTIGLAIPADVQDFGARCIRLRRLPSLMLQQRYGRFNPNLQRFLMVVADTYTKIDSAIGHRAVIDSSKDPSMAYALSLILGIELHIVHLVRDPRGVVESWKRPKGYLPKVGLWKALWWWWMYNLFSEFLRVLTRNYVRIRYEDFIENPKFTIEAIAERVLKEKVEAGFFLGRAAHVGIQHLLAGNPDKLNVGEIQIRQQPMIQMGWLKKLIISLITLPLLYRYGYQL